MSQTIKSFVQRIWKTNRTFDKRKFLSSYDCSDSSCLGVEWLRQPQCKRSWLSSLSPAADFYSLYSPAYTCATDSIQNEDMSEHNNSIKLALWESLRIDSSLSRPDLVIFVKTGTSRKINSSRAASFRHVLFDDFIPRLWRAYMFSFDGESNFRDVVNSLNRENREDYKRFNVVLSRNESTIDNISRMNELRQLVLNSQMIRECKKTIYVLLIVSFYFELSSISSSLSGNRIRCLEMIRCRLSDQVMMKLLERIHSSRLFFVTHSKALKYYLDKRDLCSSCRRYRKSVKFIVRDLNQLISIYATSARRPRRKISAFSQTMQWFVDQQHLDASFDTIYHESLNRSCKSCVTVAYCELKRQASDNKGRHESLKKSRLY